MLYYRRPTRTAMSFSCYIRLILKFILQNRFVSYRICCNLNQHFSRIESIVDPASSSIVAYMLCYVNLPATRRKEAEFLRIVSKKLTAWARDAAVSQGFADFCQVYDPLESLLGDSCENYNDSFFNENGKRNMVEESSQCFITEDRHVRPCLSRAISA